MRVRDKTSAGERVGAFDTVDVGHQPAIAQQRLHCIAEPMASLERMAGESSTYYLLGYQPEKAPDGKWHKLEVKVARPGTKVRTRRGYRATPPPALEASSVGSSGKKAANDKKAARITDVASDLAGLGGLILKRNEDS